MMCEGSHGIICERSHGIPKSLQKTIRGFSRPYRLESHYALDITKGHMGIPKSLRGYPRVFKRQIRGFFSLCVGHY